MRPSAFLIAGMFLTSVGMLPGCASNDEGPTGDPTLISLTVSVGPLTPSFDPNTTVYTTSTGFSTTTATVMASATEANASVVVDGILMDVDGVDVDLAEGRNVLNVQVITTGGAVKVYAVEVTRGTEVNFVRKAYAKASNTGADDHFGYSVALDGDTLAIGAPSEDSGVTGNDADNSALDAGAVYVFVRDINGVWNFDAYLKPLVPGAGDRFGWSVALSGNRLAVGAPSEDSGAIGTPGDNGAVDAGAAYVFVYDGTTWNQTAYVKASNVEAGDRFGWNVALSGDTLAVGAPLEDSASRESDLNETDNGASNAGAAYVFHDNGTAWSQQGYIKASNADAGDDFGISVALSGDTLAVGASGESSLVPTNRDNNGARTAGAVYVFVRDSNGVWNEEAYIKAETPGAADAFGWSVALDGDTLLVGAPLEDGADTGVGGVQESNGAVDSGAAYVFFRTGTTWDQQGYMKASNTNASDAFGWRVAVSGDTLAVSAPGEDSAVMEIDGDQTDNSALTAGAVYVFTRNVDRWTQLDYVKTTTVSATYTASGDGFGGSVALSGGTLSVGAIGEDSKATDVGGDENDNSALTSGAAYVFERIP